MTSLAQRVYAAVACIPRGRVSTYKLIADYLHCRSPRAVGQALKRNPFAPGVPCHRVIASNMTIGGFRGATAGDEVQAKLALLAREGVHFEAGRLKDRGRLFRPT